MEVTEQKRTFYKGNPSKLIPQCQKGVLNHFMHWQQQLGRSRDCLKSEWMDSEFCPLTVWNQTDLRVPLIAQHSLIISLNMNNSCSATLWLRVQLQRANHRVLVILFCEVCVQQGVDVCWEWIRLNILPHNSHLCCVNSSATNLRTSTQWGDKWLILELISKLWC